MANTKFKIALLLSTVEALFSKNLFSRSSNLFATVIVIINWICFKIEYPWPDFFSDSYSYMEAAISNRNINIWPIGYSKFLLVFHHITNSDIALVTFQYFALELACLYFFLILKSIVKLGQFWRYILFIFLFINPFNLYTSNYVSSDALFCALTLIWATELIRILFYPSPYRIILPAICTIIAFTMRYNAMYYPIITVITFFLSKQTNWGKIIGSIIIIPMLLCFYFYSRDAGQKLTGKPIWSILSGWQWANNALYMRGFINVDSTNFPSQECRNLDRLSLGFFKTMGPGIRDILNTNQGNFFIQYVHSPLKDYMFVRYPPGGVREWGEVSPLYADYGISLIKTHPVAFMKYYIWLNMGNYMLPSLEKLRIYNLGQKYIWPTGIRWFQYKSNNIYCISPTLQGKIMPFFSYYFLVINSIFLFVALLELTSTGFWRTKIEDRNLVLVWVLFWLANFGFSVFANIIVLRYQLFPMIFLTAGSLVIAEKYLLKKNITPSPNIENRKLSPKV
jgi:hypothetical protein